MIFLTTAKKIKKFTTKQKGKRIFGNLADITTSFKPWKIRRPYKENIETYKKGMNMIKVCCSNWIVFLYNNNKKL